MQKHALSFSIITALIFIVIISSSCGSDKKKTDVSDSTKIQVVKPFSVGNYNFAILENAKFIPYNKAIYHRGDEVYMVLENVGPFAKDKDSLNHAEMKMEVTNSIGELVTRRENLFGSRGEGNFKNNILKSPYASYESDLKDKPGKFTLSVTIYDLLKKDSIVVSDDFFLE